MTIGDNTALILEGGGLRGVFTCGVLDCFMDKGVTARVKGRYRYQRLSLGNQGGSKISDLLIPIVFLIGDSNAVREILRRRHIS